MVAWRTLIMMIAILATFLILLFAVVVPYMEAAKEKGESAICGLKWYLTTAAQKGTLGLVAPKTPPECATRTITVDKKEIKKHLEEAKIAIDKYYSNTTYFAEVIQYFDPDSEASQWEWALDKIIADQLFDCWAYKAIFGSINTVDFLKAGTTCLECAIIEFDDVKDIKEKIGIGTNKHKKPYIRDKNFIGSLGAFLRTEYIGLEKGDQIVAVKTYDEFINNQNQFNPLIDIPYDFDRKWSVIYVMTRDYTIIPLYGRVQKVWMELWNSDYLTTESTSFGRYHQACEKILGA